METLADILLVANVVLAAFMLLIWVTAAYTQPARYLWLIMTKKSVGNITYIMTAFIAVMLVARLGKDSPEWQVFLAGAAVSTFLWWFINHVHRKAIEFFEEDCKQTLPGSCPLCVLYRVGAHYKFRKRTDPIQDHPGCPEKR